MWTWNLEKQINSQWPIHDKEQFNTMIHTKSTYYSCCHLNMQYLPLCTCLYQSLTKSSKSRLFCQSRIRSIPHRNGSGSNQLPRTSWNSFKYDLRWYENATPAPTYQTGRWNLDLYNKRAKSTTLKKANQYEGKACQLQAGPTDTQFVIPAAYQYKYWTSTGTGKFTDSKVSSTFEKKKNPVICQLRNFLITLAFYLTNRFWGDEVTMWLNSRGTGCNAAVTGSNPAPLQTTAKSRIFCWFKNVNTP